MNMILGALLFLFAGALSALFARDYKRGACAAVTGQALAFLCGVIAIVQLFTQGALSLKLAWSIPFGSFFLTLDRLSALFFFLILLIGLLAGIYGVSYLRHWQNEPRARLSWVFYNLLLLSMCLVVLARNGILFLLAWEVMTIASFFLVTFESEKKSVCQAGWLYLTAAHIGTAFLLAMFILLAKSSGSFDFDRFSAFGPLASCIFIFAILGFGVKAGFLPLHVWLPEAHPAAPSHVSAVMSGVMIKMGIYGLIRTLTFLGTPPLWWGELLIAIGVVSGVLGVLFALAQHDIKRLLAYHSIENIGIIVMGLGFGVMGLSSGLPYLAVLGFGGCIFHTLNHALFKSQLFLAAGAVIKSTGTGDVEHLGGLLKRMPLIGGSFLAGSAAISGLPPLNGFASEFLIYLAAFSQVISGGRSVGSGLAVITGMALIGCLAALCFAKVFSIVFLGEPRSLSAAQAHEPPKSMQFISVILAGLCVVCGLLAPVIVIGLSGAIYESAGLFGTMIDVSSLRISGLLTAVTIVSVLFLAMAAGISSLRRKLLSGRKIGQGLTWDCGYARSHARMQYSASSLVQPVTNFFKFILRSRSTTVKLQEIFPPPAEFSSHTPDLFHEKVYQPVFQSVYKLFLKLHRLGDGRIQLYILYIAVTLIALLIWKLG